VNVERLRTPGKAAGNRDYAFGLGFAA